MYQDVNNIVESTRKEKRAHLDLSEPCIEIGGNSTQFRGVLSHYLKVTIPQGHKLVLCHACHNGNCSNPKHMYYGSHRDNILDEQEAGTYKSIWERKIEKYGFEGARESVRKGDKASGGRGGKGKPKSKKHREKISESLKKK